MFSKPQTQPFLYTRFKNYFKTDVYVIFNATTILILRSDVVFTPRETPHALCRCKQELPTAFLPLSSTLIAGDARVDRRLL